MLLLYFHNLPKTKVLTAVNVQSMVLYIMRSYRDGVLSNTSAQMAEAGANLLSLSAGG